REIAVRMKADKLIYMSKDKGILDDHKDLISIMTLDTLKEIDEQNHIKGYLDLKIKNAIIAIEKGVHRVHIIDGTVAHSILLELFSINGIGTAILDSKNSLYKHERDEIQL
ncbi:MAG: acetylglutamate kinase, partial [Faecalibacillus sp.]